MEIKTKQDKPLFLKKGDLSLEMTPSSKIKNLRLTRNHEKVIKFRSDTISGPAWQVNILTISGLQTTDRPKDSFGEDCRLPTEDCEKISSLTQLSL